MERTEGRKGLGTSDEGGRDGGGDGEGERERGRVRKGLKDRGCGLGPCSYMERKGQKDKERGLGLGKVGENCRERQGKNGRASEGE